ncbi:MAG TPA: hypothetical protein VJ302_10275 [Blastocatellia bacterium]|nr:hypothetical protein [Blastocatellia bacterium]
MSQLIAYLIIVGVVGFFIGHFWTRRRTAEAWTKDRVRLESKVRGSDRDIEKLRAELKSFREQSTTLKHQLATSTNKLKARDGEFGDLEARLHSVSALESEVSAKDARLEELTTEINSLRSRLAKAEADLKRPIEPDPTLYAEINTLKQQLSGREGEITTLLNRVKELAPLSLQIKDRDLRLREWETRYSTGLKDRDDQIAKLTSQIEELQTKLQSVNGSHPEPALTGVVDRRDAGGIVE